MIRKVAVIMGSDSDWPVVKGACAQLKALDIPFEAHILSAHSTFISLSGALPNNIILIRALIRNTTINVMTYIKILVFFFI